MPIQIRIRNSARQQAGGWQVITFGILSQIAALFFTLLSMGLLLAGLGRNNVRLVQAGKRGLLSAMIATTLASVALAYLFLTDNFQVEYVASYSDRALPIFYKATAFWAGQKGSLLFWAWVLSLFIGLVIFNNRKEPDDRNTPYVYLVMAGTLSFFLFIFYSFNWLIIYYFFSNQFFLVTSLNYIYYNQHHNYKIECRFTHWYNFVSKDF